MTATGRGVRCPWCQRVGRTLTQAGALRRHLRYTREFSGELPPECAGSGRAPREFFEEGRVQRQTVAEKS